MVLKESPRLITTTHFPIESKVESIQYKVGAGDFINPISPKEALDSPMEAIGGDRSPLSYLQASILSREIGEYGAPWHDNSWSHHVVLPVYYAEDPKYEWIMYEEEPEIINPYFYYDESENPTIVYYTISNLGTISLNEYKHTFSKDNYSFRLAHRVLGTAGQGYVL